jgi:hypothetical protein
MIRLTIMCRPECVTPVVANLLSHDIMMLPLVPELTNRETSFEISSHKSGPAYTMQIRERCCLKAAKLNENENISTNIYMGPLCLR